jgi:3-oxoacyl-[acyl-carrier protein] reductase
MTGEVALVTGSGQGIGHAIAIELERAGATVLRNDVLFAGAAKGGELRFECSVASIAEVTDMTESIMRDHGRIDILVNTAGVVARTALPKVDTKAWQHVVGVNLAGHMNLISCVLPIMAAQQSGRVVNFTSAAALGRGHRDLPSYMLAKRGVAELTWQLGRTMPSGVSMNAVAPRAATRMNRASTTFAETEKLLPPSYLAPFIATLCHRNVAITGEIFFLDGRAISVYRKPEVQTQLIGGTHRDSSIRSAVDSMMRDLT